MNIGGRSTFDDLLKRDPKLQKRREHLQANAGLKSYAHAKYFRRLFKAKLAL